MRFYFSDDEGSEDDEDELDDEEEEEDNDEDYHEVEEEHEQNGFPISISSKPEAVNGLSNMIAKFDLNFGTQPTFDVIIFMNFLVVF